MAAQYIVDSSVILKWLNGSKEEDLEQALELLYWGETEKAYLFSSELCIYEVFNVLVRGKLLRGKILEEALEVFWRLPLILLATDQATSQASARIAVEQNITMYDAVFLSLAFQHDIPLITSNIKHHKSTDTCNVIPLGNWK